jgi:hypothetical protein
MALHRVCVARCYSAIYLGSDCFALVLLICIYMQRTRHGRGRTIGHPCPWIVGLAVAYIYTRCVATAKYAHFQMVKRYAVLKEHIEYKDRMYRYVSRSDPRPRPKNEIVIFHHAEGLCTCAFYGQSAGASPAPWKGRTWCKHIVGVALLLVDPATQVRILGMR